MKRPFNCFRNILLNIFFLSSFEIYSQQEYQEVIQEHAQEWASCIATLSDDRQLETIIDMLLLSYQIAQESCVMIIAKLTMQKEILKIYTPSLNDTWQANLQVQYNDTSKLETAIQTIKNSQNNFQKLYKKLKNLAPQLVQMNPQPTQTLIYHLKQSLICWGKHQQNLTEQLVTVQEEFSQAITTISDIKLLFNTIFKASEYHHSHLKDAAGFVAKTFKDIEHVIDHLTLVREESIYKIQQFSVDFFATYYQTVYKNLSPEQIQSLSIQASHDGKLPLPNDFFQ